MKISDIAAILDSAELPTPTREQLLALAGTSAGKRFGEALRAFGSGDISKREELHATVLALDPTVQARLRRLAGECHVDRLAAAAQQERRRLFDAMTDIEDNSSAAPTSRAYLHSLGLLPATPPAAELPAPPYYNFHIFGAHAALCVSEARTRKSNQHTVQIEGAHAVGDTGHRKTFDWPNKIIVQLTVQEAFQLLALFENRIDSVKFDGHGRAHDKSLHIACQGSHYFVRVIQRGRAAVALPVRPVDAIPIVSLLYKQLLKNEPHLRVEDLQVMLERMCGMAKQKATSSLG